MRVCHVCGEENPPTVVICGRCRSQLSIPPPAKRTAPPRAEPAEPPATPAGSTCAAPRCGAIITPGATQCAYCYRPVHRWTISRAGMSVTVPDDRPLELGRHAETTARLFADTTNVSRRHAIVCAVEQGLEVTDQQSSNGTFVNGRRCTPFAPHPLGEGDELRLAMDVILGVTCG